MDGTTASISSSRNNDEVGMKKVLSEGRALKRLYGLLHRGPGDEKLDETSRALLMKILDDATQKAHLRQAKTPIHLGLIFPKNMEQATPSISSIRNSVGIPEETVMEKVSSDIKALERLYRLLHQDPGDENLDETSRALLMKMLDDASQQAVLRRAGMLSGSSMPPALEGKSIRSDRRTRDIEPCPSLRPLSSPRPNLLAGEESRRLNLQHSTVSSRASRHVHDHRRAAEGPLLARLASNRSSRTALPPRRRPGLEPLRSGLSLHRLSEASTSQDGTVTGSTRRAEHRDGTRRSSHRGDQSSLEHGSRQRATEEPLLARLASNRSSRTALPPTGLQPLDSGLCLHRLSEAATSQHGTVTGSTRRAEHRDRTRRSSRRGDQSSLERGSRRRSVSRELSLGRSQLPVARRMGAGSTSSTLHHFERQDSGLSLTTTVRRGPERASPERSSPSHTEVTTRSRIRPNSVLTTERGLRRSAEEDITPHRRRWKDTDDVSSASWSSSRPRGTLNRTDSGSSRRSSPAAAASLSPSTSPRASPASIASASYPSSPVPRQRSAWPENAREVSGSLRRRRRRERQERRVELLRGLKNKVARALDHLHEQGLERRERRVQGLRKFTAKIAKVFHHRHDHHHYHHLGRGHLVEEVPSSRRAIRAHQRKSPWEYLGGMFQFHRGKGKDKKTTSRTVAGVPGKRRGGGGTGNMRALFGAMGQHLRGRRRAPAASVTMRRAARSRSRVQANKMQWWKGLRGRRGRAEMTAGSTPRRRLGHG